MWAPRPGSLTRTRRAAWSRDAPAGRAAGQGHGVPRSRGGADHRPECGPESCGGGVAQQLHQLSPYPESLRVRLRRSPLEGGAGTLEWALRMRPVTGLAPEGKLLESTLVLSLACSLDWKVEK